MDPRSIERICQLPDRQNIYAWQYEHLRQIALELNQLVVDLCEACNATSCPTMRASDWVFRCAAHQQPRQCTAMDYIVHTLDNTVSMLNSNKWFPSRVSIQVDSKKQLQSIARRLYRVLAHAYFHHINIFEAFESRTCLCRRFHFFIKLHDLVPTEHMIIPTD
eukprot:c15697_g1_i2.p1 GENE.c15697_g1_i2~~c15697_g1_i2.p1  ORF type:complete len:163 (+),score=25.99 c15697_g1_i2:206-694(+)